MPASIVLYETSPTLAESISNGVRLWHAEADVRSKNGTALAGLWERAEAVMDIEQGKQRFLAQQKQIKECLPASLLKTEWLTREYQPTRASDMFLLVMGGDYKPKLWKSKAKFPYAGLAMAAYYFLEAMNFQDAGEELLAWASITQGYYYLGTNSSAVTLHEFSSAAGKIRGADYTRDLRDLVVKLVQTLPQDGTIKSAAEAYRRVASIIESKEIYLAVLHAFDAKTPSKSKLPRDGKNIASTPIDRLKKNLENWSAGEYPDIKYPDIHKAFAPFKRK